MAAKYKSPSASSDINIPSLTKFLKFRAQVDFEYRAMNASAASLQKGRRKGKYMTSANQFANTVVLANPDAFRAHEGAVSVTCLDPMIWPQTNFSGRKVLFLIPSQALGNNVCIALFLRAFMAQSGARNVAVACAQGSSDIFRWVRGLKVYSLFLSEKEFTTWDKVIDLAHLEGRRNIEFWPIDMETELLRAFNLQPDNTIQTSGRNIANNRALNIGVFPLASSPLRTLPVRTTSAIVKQLAATGHKVTLCLNKMQQQSQLFEAALQDNDLPAGLHLHQGYQSIGALMQAIAEFDFVVMADSGPAHITKLSATPGLAIYTSAPAEILLGRFKNLKAWTVEYSGNHCQAPCGLAKIRQTADSRVGCMGSLSVSVKDLPTTPNRNDGALLSDLMQNPVPCVAALRDYPEALLSLLANLLGK